MNSDDMNDDDLSLLTDEERAGLEEDDSEDAPEGDGADGADEAVEDEEEEISEPEAEAEPEADQAAATAKAKEEPGRDDGSDDDDDTPSPRLTGDRVDPGTVNTRLDAIKAEKKGLAEQLDDGEITTSEYTEAVDKLNDEKNDLSNRLARQEDQDKSVQDAWYRDVERFMGKHSDIGTNQTRLQSFDSVVRRVTGDEANASLSNRKQLEKAYSIWREEMGFAQQAAQPEPKPKTSKVKQATPKVELPPTLHNVPAAEMNVGDDGKFSYLDGLLNAGKMIEYEDALAKLSEADQQDYLSRA